MRELGNWWKNETIVYDKMHAHKDFAWVYSTACSGTLCKIMSMSLGLSPLSRAWSRLEVISKIGNSSQWRQFGLIDFIPYAPSPRTNTIIRPSHPFRLLPLCYSFQNVPANAATAPICIPEYTSQFIKYQQGYFCWGWDRRQKYWLYSPQKPCKFCNDYYWFF